MSKTATEKLTRQDIVFAGLLAQIEAQTERARLKAQGHPSIVAAIEEISETICKVRKQMETTAKEKRKASSDNTD